MTESDKSLFVRMDSFEKTLDKTVEDVDKLKSNSSALERIAAITELHINEIRKREEKQEIREERQELTMKELTSALTKIDGNLDKLNSGQNELESRMDKVEENSRIDIMKLIKNIIWIGTPTAFFTWLGLK